MISAISEEKQDHIRRLLKRWKRANSLLLVCFPTIVLALAVTFLVAKILAALPLSHSMRMFWNDIARMFLIMPINALGIIVIFKRRAAFVRQLSPADRELLEQASRIASKSERKTAKHLLKACAELDEKNELLRASARTQDDGTLLRPTTAPSETPREQLLRAANNTDA